MAIEIEFKARNEGRGARKRRVFYWTFRTWDTDDLLKLSKVHDWIVENWRGEEGDSWGYSLTRKMDFMFEYGTTWPGPIDDDQWVMELLCDRSDDASELKLVLEGLLAS